MAHVIMAVARTDADAGTLLRPEITIHNSIKDAQEDLWTRHIQHLTKEVQQDDPIDSMDDHRINCQANLTGTTSIDVDLDPIQLCATIKVVA